MLTLPFWRELCRMRDTCSACATRPTSSPPFSGAKSRASRSRSGATRGWSSTRAHCRRRAVSCAYSSSTKTYSAGREQVTRMAAFLGLDAPTNDEGFQGAAAGGDRARIAPSTSAHELAGAAAIPPEARTLFLALRAAEDARRVDAKEDGRSGGASEAIERVAPSSGTSDACSPRRVARIDRPRTTCRAVRERDEESTVRAPS